MFINALAIASFLMGLPTALSTAPQITLWPTTVADVPFEKVEQIVTTHVNTTDYREVKAQVIRDKKQRPHLLIYLFSPKYHGFQTAKVDFNSGGFEANYRLSDDDIAEQPRPKDLACPDTKVQFIAFAPNNIPCEQQVTTDVATAAEAKGLKTVRLLMRNATSENFMNYMSCPNLKGIFYDGDGDPEAITTSNGVITSKDIAYLKLHHNVTNIWVACEAFNNPMKKAAITEAESQKYAAGINDLLIGPSDEMAKCAMIEAFDGGSMTDAFWTCYKKLDNVTDEWGFAGNGSDYFGQ